MSRQINLSVVEDNPSNIPDEVQRMGMESLHILWQTSQDIAQKEINTIKKRYQQYEFEVMAQRQEALDKATHVNNELAVAKSIIETLTREKKSLQVDLNRKIGELKSSGDQITILQHNLIQQDNEVRRLSEEVGQVRERADSLKKSLYEATRKNEQAQSILKELREEVAVNRHSRDRLETELKSVRQEANEVWKQLAGEQRRAAIAETTVHELRETVKKYEGDIKLLKEEKQDIQANMAAENKTRVEMEKKVAMLTVRLESQETGYKEIIARMEQELEMAKNEASSVRTRMIRAEAALEREKKATERLETKLVAVSRATT
ncbi:MAG: hypothetical protein DRR19_19500 [Candidatus Parabeggiatoa sp. nov. 1]|nr:MAG: hypothetical protein DRR19_19500 [Gammaproteobacteria bacterium]